MLAGQANQKTYYSDRKLKFNHGDIVANKENHANERELQVTLNTEMLSLLARLRTHQEFDMTSPLCTNYVQAFDGGVVVSMYIYYINGASLSVSFAGHNPVTENTRSLRFLLCF